MKKIFLSLLVFSLLFTGCKKNSSSSNNSLESFFSQEGSNEHSNSDENPIISSSENISENSEVEVSSLSSEEISNSHISSESVINKKLKTPILTLNEETGVVTWTEVEGASYYNYIINDGSIQTTTSTTITLKDKENISVQASNDTSYSYFSNAITYYDVSDVELEYKKDLKVHFHDSQIKSISVKEGEMISRPNNPSKNNYIFDDWYKDPFYQEKFNFNEPIVEKTIVYANWIPTSLVENTYYWMKASPKITSNVISSTTSSSGWRFIPLKLNQGQTSYKEFYATVTVTGASELDPAYFIIMDGFDDNLGRTYWKKDTVDFTIKSDGTYNVYFSVEHQFATNCHGLVVPVNNSGVSYLQRVQSKENVKTPVVTINTNDNIASWSYDENATGYEVIINNGTVQKVVYNSIYLDKASHITVRSVYDEETKSNWSIPQANIRYVEGKPELSEYAYVYFAESNQSSTKVEKGTKVNSIDLVGDGIRTFGGWYLEPGLKTKVTFPYTVNENVTFYPKWNYPSDIYTKDYYYLVDQNGVTIDGFVWNYDNFDFYEYEIKNIKLKAGTYKVKSLDKSIIYETFEVTKDAKYSIYFSEDKLWNNQGISRHIYLAEVITTINIYFTNNRRWDGTITAYYWNNTTSTPHSSWPGSAMKLEKTNEYGENIYKVTIDLELYDYVIFTNGSSQSQDIPLTLESNNLGFYCSGTKDSKGHHIMSTYNYA